MEEGIDFEILLVISRQPYRLIVAAYRFLKVTVRLIYVSQSGVCQSHTRSQAYRLFTQR